MFERKIMKKLFIIGLSFIIVLFTGCSKQAYNAKMYGHVYENRKIINDVFFENNLTNGSYSSVLETYIDDEAYPSTRVKIIKNKDDYNEVFKEFYDEIDFEEEMLVMYCFTTSSGESYKIKSLSLEEDLLTIKYEFVRRKLFDKSANASVPISKWIIVKMEKLNTKEISFIMD